MRLARFVRRPLCAAAVIVPSAALAAQSSEGAVELRQACLDATTDALVLNVAAHPDDEADRTLVWLRHKLGVRTVTVYSTHGSGGQNAIGPEIGPALARIRVRETLAAARHTGVAVRWLGFSDFGYSKTTEETLQQWGGLDAVAARMAAVVGELDPDVVLTNHSLERGHGHHRASAAAIRAVLQERAARGQSTPLFERVFVPARAASAPSEPPVIPDWECDPFEYDPVRGATYAQQASDGRHEHRTQGPWSPHDPMRQAKDRWRIVFPAPADEPRDVQGRLQSVLRAPAFRAACAGLQLDADEIERELDGFAGDRAVATHVAAARRLLPSLRAVHAHLLASTEGERAARRLARRLDALQRIVLAGSGVEVETWLPQTRLARAGKATVRVLVHAARPEQVTELSAACAEARGVPVSTEGRGRLMLEIELDLAGAGSDGAGPSAESPEPAWIDVGVELVLDGLPLMLQRRLAAELESPLELEWDQPFLFVLARRDVERVLSLYARWQGSTELAAPLEVQLPPGVTAEVVPAEPKLSPEHPVARILVRLRVPNGAIEDERTIAAAFGSARADLRVVPADVHVDPALRVALVRGPDDTLQRVLEDLQVPVEVLDEAALAVDDLSRFGTLVLDIRAYHHRPDLADHRGRLLQFCARGGRVVSFYHKPQEWNATAGRPLLAPYPLEVGDDRVSDEAAPVTLLQADQPLWAWPHRITARDFEGWAQERGLNFAKTWDERWVPLLEMADAGEEPLRGSLLCARYESGDWIHCSLALYRQLRAGHLGAARILLNLLTPQR